MPGKLESLNFHVGAPGATPRAVAGPAHFRELNTLMGAPQHIAAFQTDEAAARHFLDTILRQDDRPGLRSLVAENVPELVPSLQLSRTRVHPHNDHRQLTFVQTASPSIRVFGSNVTVELRPNRELVSITAVLAETPNVSAVPSLTPQEALDAVKRFTNTSQLLSMVAPPTLYVYKDDQNRWRLIYLFQNVPAAPPEVAAEIQQKTLSGHGLDLSPRDLQPEFNYLVDAHTSDVVFYYSAMPTLAPGGLPVPALCTGVGEGGKTFKFYGRQVTGGFEMADGLRSIKTFDLKGGDIAPASLPPDPINNGSNNWATTRKDAVSAHANLERIFDFYNTVLFRDSVDDKRMQLNAVVNCYYSGHGPGPEWHNAVWWRNVMWFGQRSVPGGGSESYSKFLDVTAHELTHGVTQFTCGLIYRNQSGALNESVSDIFGIIIANCCDVSDQTVTGWNWEIGSG
jgi:bacillolysin